MEETCQKQRDEQLHSLYTKSDRIWFVHHEGGIVLLMAGDYPWDFEFLADLCGPEYPICVSEEFDSISHLPDHLNLARQALHYALKEETCERVIFVHDYKIPIAYLFLKQNGNKIPLDYPAKKMILEYDKEHGSDYYLTLRTYLLNGMDYLRTAKKLHVHKNTVMYRIQRITELFHLDLKDCRVITAMYLGTFDTYDGLENE